MGELDSHDICRISSGIFLYLKGILCSSSAAKESRTYSDSNRRPALVEPVRPKSVYLFHPQGEPKQAIRHGGSRTYMVSTIVFTISNEILHLIQLPVSFGTFTSPSSMEFFISASSRTQLSSTPYAAGQLGFRVLLS